MTNWNVIWSIAQTHLLTKMKSTVTATLGVTFGIGAYIILVSFMTGLNDMLDNLILNQTPHIHLYNEIKPSENQPVSIYSKYKDSHNFIHSIKPKQSQVKIHNALPILQYLKEDKKVEGATPQLRLQVFYISGSIELGGNLIGIDIMEEKRLSNISDYIVKGRPEDLKTMKMDPIGRWACKKNVPF